MGVKVNFLLSSRLEYSTATRALALPLLAKSLTKFNPKYKRFKLVLDLTCELGNIILANNFQF